MHSLFPAEARSSNGGVGVDGNALASVEFFQPSAGFAAAPPMNAARSAHTCSTLQDGRILVAGGTDGQGLPVATAEIYDPAAQSWSFAGQLNDPRWGHTATLMDDGRVLIAGGQDFYGPKDTIEIFDPAAGGFLPGDDRLSTPRMNHAAVLLPDGLVAILGGSNGAASISSVDLFLPGISGFFADTVIAAAPMQAARASFTANTLSDGTILIAGGFDGQQDLDSAEVYDLHKGSSYAPGQLNTARHGHLAILLPGNGNVVLVGGRGAGSTLASCELYDPEQGAFTAIGSLASPRARASLAVVDGGLVSAGGVSTDGIMPVASSGVLATPSVAFTVTLTGTLQGTVRVNGRNFGSAGQTVGLQVALKNSATVGSEALNGTATVAADGSFSFVSQTIKALSALWTVSASTTKAPLVKASVNQNLLFANVNLTSSCTPCTVGQPLTLTAAIVNPGNSNFNIGPPTNQSVTFFDNGVSLVTVPITPSAGPAFGPGSTIGAAKLQALQAKPTGNRTFSASIQQTSGYVGAAAPIAVQVVQIPTTISLFANPNPVLSGSSTALSSVLGIDPALVATLGTSPTGTITYQVDGSSAGTSPIGGNVSFKPAALSSPQQATHTVTASYSGDANYGSSSASVTLTEAQTLLPAVPFFGVVLPSVGLQWLIQPITGQVPLFQFTFGSVGEIPVIGDWTGSGTSSAGTFDPVRDTWNIGGPVAANVAITATFGFGRANCSMMPPSGGPLFPVAGDWDATGHAGIGVYDFSSGIWCLRNTASAGLPDFQFQFTLPNALPVVGDWDGNGTTTVGLFDRPSSTWFLRNENSGGPPDAGLFDFAGSGAGGNPLPGNWLAADPKRTGLGIVHFVAGLSLLDILQNGNRQSFQFAGAFAFDISGVHPSVVSGKMCFLCTP